MHFDFPADVLRHKQIRLCATDIFLLNAAALEVLPAPGVGYLTTVVSSQARLIAGTVAFDMNSSPALYFDQILTQIIGTAFSSVHMNQATDRIQKVDLLQGGTAVMVIANCLNLPIYLRPPAFPYVTVGNGSIVLNLSYFVIPVG